MKEKYARILAKHAAEIISHTSNLLPTRVEVVEQSDSSSTFELAVSIDIKGKSGGHDNLSGRVVIGSKLHEESRPLLLAMVRHFGLDESILDAKDGSVNILGEFLNIIIGLASSEWSEQGFDLNFSTPQDISGQPLPQVTVSGATFRIKVYVDDTLMGDLQVFFN